MFYKFKLYSIASMNEKGKNNINNYSPKVAKILNHDALNKSYFANGLFFDKAISMKGSVEWKNRAAILQNKLNGAREVTGVELENLVKFYKSFVNELNTLIGEAEDEVRVLRRKEKINMFLDKNKDDEELAAFLKKKGFKE